MKRTVIIQAIKPVFRDKRGEISDLLNHAISHVGLITTAKGAVRASHYHRKSHQFSYILSGSFEVLTAPAKRPASVTRHVVRAGELISIAPNVIHRFKALKKAVMVDMISESRARGSYEGDVVRIPYEDGAFVPTVRT